MMRFLRSSSIRCWCTKKGRASPSSTRWWSGNRRVGKGALAPCPPCIHDVTRGSGHASPCPRYDACRGPVACRPYNVGSQPPEIRDAAFGGGLDALLEILSRAQFRLLDEFVIGRGQHALGKASAH